MAAYLEKKKSHLIYRIFSFFLLFTFTFSMLISPTRCFAQMAGTYQILPPPGAMVTMTPAYIPAIIKGITIDPQNPLHFNFIVDTGDSQLQGEELAQESRKLIKYFLATLTTPEHDLWVNLSPYEKDRIIPEAFGKTEMGRDLLAEDYLLKQLTASLMYPEQELGQTFWDRVSEKAQTLYGNTDIPVDTFNKVWIVPQTATLYEHENTVIVVETHLKVMLEEDYIALQQSAGDSGSLEAISGYDKSDSTVASEVIREVIIPEIEKEVNTGETFAKLRQIYNSMILATWYKTNLQQSLLGQIYVDQNKIGGIDLEDKTEKDKIYQQYLEAFKTGVYNYMKEEYDPATQEVIPKKYFSGGMEFRSALKTAIETFDYEGITREQRREIYEKIKTQVEKNGVASTINNIDVYLQEFGLNAREAVVSALDAFDAQQLSDSSLRATNPVLPRVNPTQTDSWNNLQDLAATKQINLRNAFTAYPERASDFRFDLNNEFTVDLSKNLIDRQVIEQLVDLARESGLPEAIEQMFTGEKINETEDRAVLHTALRNVTRDPSGKLISANGPVYVDGADVMPGVIKVLEKMEGFTKKIQSGEWRGFNGKKIKNVVNVGIGGSDLGPKMAAEALKPFKTGDTEVYYLSNIDGTAAAELMSKLDPTETLVIVASKTFTTQETMQNAQTLKDWVLNAYNGDLESIKKHFVAVSTATELVKNFGIDTNNMFEFWDWVGGRYSVWSAIGLSLATYVGFDNFLQFLEGGREADENFRNQPLDKNISVLKALINVWYGNFKGAKSFAILPYDQYLGLFPSFSQQFFMESNGKRVDRAGNPVNYSTGLTVFGSAGTDGQHSYYQAIHHIPDGSFIPADFIGVINTQNPIPGHHDKLYSNFVAQTEALAFGLTHEEVQDALAGNNKYADAGEDYLNWFAEQKTFTGDKPTTSIIMDEVTPRTLGNLVAMYENQIFTEGVIWNIFSFDQFGVEEGKRRANSVLAFLSGQKSLEELNPSVISSSGEYAVRKYAERKRREILPVVSKLNLRPVNTGIRPVKFGTSGDRGQFNNDFTPDHKRRIDQGIAEYFQTAAPGKTMYVGYDPRQDNVQASLDAAQIYAANGITTKLVIGEPTAVPVLAFLTNNDPNAGGMTVFTASHSPASDGGIKFSPEHGGAAPTAVTDQITKFANSAESFNTVDYQKGKDAGLIEEISPEEVQRQYVDNYVVPKLKELGAWDDMVNFLKTNPDFELVLDPMQGAGSRYIQAIYGKLAEDVGRQFFTMVNTDNTDPMFREVNNEPNPTKEKSRATLVSKVTSKERAMGLSVDADADRFGAVDQNGDFISANDQIAMMAYFLKKEIGLEGAIGKTVATSNFVNAVATALNEELDEEAVGFKNFVRKTTDEGRQYLVAGEESSHVAVGPFMQSWDDGIVVGLMTFWMTARTGKSLTEYKDEIQRDLNKKFMIETMTYRGKDDSIKAVVNAKIAQTNKELKDGVTISDLSLVKELEAAGTPKVVDIITKDGVKLVFETGDWMLMRPSGTEPAVKFYVEVAAPYSADSQEMQTTFNTLKSIGELAIGVATDKAMRASTGETGDEDGLRDTLEQQRRTLNRQISEVKAQNKTPVGGIDLNPALLDLQIKRDGNGVPLPLPQQPLQNMNINGFLPVIINITPMTNLPMLMGMSETDQRQDIAQYSSADQWMDERRRDQF